MLVQNIYRVCISLSWCCIIRLLFVLSFSFRIEERDPRIEINVGSMNMCKLMAVDYGRTCAWGHCIHAACAIGLKLPVRWW